MGDIDLRIPTASDWPAILGLANAALPWDTEGNQEWLENRKQFTGLRRHYVAIGQSSGTPLGYGTIEEGPDPGVFRMFIVADPDHLHGTIGDLIYQRLRTDLTNLDAEGVWVREYARDDPVIAFFTERGFAEHNRFTLPGHQEMVVLVKPLG